MVRLVNSRQALQTRRRHERQGAPRLIIRPSSQRHLAQARYDDSIVGRSKEEASTLSAPLRRKLCSSALNSLRNNNDAGAFMVQFEFSRDRVHWQIRLQEVSGKIGKVCVWVADLVKLYCWKELLG